jgi:hypothetical protein
MRPGGLYYALAGPMFALILVCVVEGHVANRKSDCGLFTNNATPTAGTQLIQAPAVPQPPLGTDKQSSKHTKTSETHLHQTLTMDP